MHSFIGTAAAAAAVATVLVAGTTAAEAKSGDVIRTGDCSGRAHWKVKAGPDNGRIEVEAEIDSNRSGQRWTWRMRHDGVLVGSGVRHTGGVSGSFTVRRAVTDGPGADTITFRARRPATGQVCRGVVTF
jgi:hypothetical protein